MRGRAEHRKAVKKSVKRSTETAKVRAARKPAEGKKPRRRYTLDALLKGMTPKNLHPEIDFGPPVGREIL